MIGPREEDVLPTGWQYGADVRGAFALSPDGRAYRTLPQGYEPADIGIFDDIVKSIVGEDDPSISPEDPE